MGRAAAIAVLACGVGAFGAGALSSQEIFWDGFDYGDLCAWSNPPAVYQEQEAFDDSGTNDVEADAELIPTRCAIVEGTIGEPYDSEPGPDVVWVFDTDTYELSLEGPALVRFRVERFGDQSLFQPALTYLYNSSAFGDYGLFPEALPLDDPTLLEREFYLPENGFEFLDPAGNYGTKDLPGNNKWWLYVEDLRNYVLEECSGIPCGDEQNRYRLTITIESIAGPTLPFPFSEEQVSYPADGSVRSYRVPDGVTSLTLTETLLDQFHPGFTDLDTRLLIVKKVGSSLQTIAGNDDWEFTPGGDPVHTDSKIGSTPLTGGPYFVIVDHYAKFSPDAVDFALTIQYLQTLWH